MLSPFSLFALLISGLLAPSLAHAQVSALPGIISALFGGVSLPPTVGSVQCAMGAGVGIGACNLAGLFVSAVQQGRLLIGGLALVVIIVAGFRLVISQSEEALGTAQKTILSAIVGLFVVFLSESFVDALYGGFSTPPGGAPAAGPTILSDEILGVVRYVETTVAIIAIGLIIVQAIYVLGGFGNEEGIRKMYRAILYSIVGILIIIFDQTIAAVFGYTTIGGLPGAPSVFPVIVETFGLLRLLLAFVAAIVIGVIVYAGALMLLHYGNEEWITRGKGILLNCVIGLALIVVAFVLVSTVILAIAP
jgi:hypothetical protein